MKKYQDQIKEFMLKAGQDCPDKPIIPEMNICMLRYRLIDEELAELRDGFISESTADVADAIADLLVVVIGTAVACGINIEPVFDEVMRSNMTKFIDGYKRADGKWMKGPSYSPANIAPIIESQKCNPWVTKLQKTMNELSNDEAIRIFEALAELRQERPGFAGPEQVSFEDRLWDSLCRRFVMQVGKTQLTNSNNDNQLG